MDDFKGRYYQQVAPRSFPCFGASEDGIQTTPSELLQARILDEVLLRSAPPVISLSYRLLTIRHMIRSLERAGNVVDERLMEVYAELLTTRSTDQVETTPREIVGRQSTLFPPASPSDEVEVHYIYAPGRYISLRESPSVLTAEGTTGEIQSS